MIKYIFRIIAKGAIKYNFDMKIYDVLILGAGASGLMCASNLDKKLSVAIVDCNSKIAQKIKISGGSKCNITNTQLSRDNYDGDKEFIFNVFETFSRDDLLEYLQEKGLEPVVRKKRYYFCKDSSDEVISIFKKGIKNADLFLNNEVLWVKKDGDIFDVKTLKELYRAKKVVVATGGKSYKNLGASDIGIEIAKSFSIKVKEFTPALVGLTVQKEQFWMKELSGLSCYANIKVDGKILKEELLFAHKGISGPVVLSASLYWQKGNIAIDFLPNDNILELIKGSKKQLSSVMPLPKRLSKALLAALDIEDVECKKVTNEIKEKLARIHDYEFAPAGNFGFSKAEVCKGGLLTDELNPYTMETLDVKGLYFIGEVVDVTGELGGYNFQWAFSSGYVCAKGISES